ncbi:MAG: hypothetical protein FOGNACKC_00772 [Anaerolineae bacterium]|nr:hypothetical protein [Anaerolineae bacterium]
MIRGGHLNEVPLPHRRRWPDDPQPREVVITILTWAGLSPGATHFHLDVHEEDNPIWDSRTQREEMPGLYEEVVDKLRAEGREVNHAYWDGVCGWRVCWDDEEGKGRKETSIHNSAVSAVEAGRQLIAERYSDGAWRVRSTATDETTVEYFERVIREWTPVIKRARREGD